MKGHKPGVSFASESEVKMKPYDDLDYYGGKLPREFRKFKPLGMENHNFNIILDGVITHSLFLYGLLYLYPFGILPIKTFIFPMIYAILTGIGVTVGVHRYWAHRTFKANLPLQIFLMLFQTVSHQKSIFKWAREHRIHHKYTDTNADPYSSARGFYFSHMGWIWLPSHPDLVEKEKTIYVTDLVNDPVVRFQSKYYWELWILMFFMVPMGIEHLLHPEISLFHHVVIVFMRFAITVHVAASVNSVAHIWGSKPYDKNISPVENKLVAIFTLGEGWHNYHHTFPWDYKAAEFGYRHNLSTIFLNFFAQIGWVWDMKTVSPKLLVDRINRTGDGSHEFHKKGHDNGNGNGNQNEVKTKNENWSEESKPGSNPANYWGWGDKELREEDLEITETVYPDKKEINGRG